MEQEKHTSEKIIKAACRVFAEKGLSGARMHQIAKTAGVNQALLHYYFGSKEKLYQEVIYRVFLEIFSKLSGYFQNSEPIDVSFKKFIHAFIDILRNHPELPRLIISEIIEGARNITPALDRVFQELGSKPPAFLIPLIESAAAQGLIRQVDPMQTVISIVGMCVFYFVGKPIIQFVWDGPKDEARFLEERKDAIIDLVLHGLLKHPDEPESIT